MKSIEKYPTRDEIFNAIACDFAYPVLHSSGQLQWRASNILLDLIFQRLAADEALFDALKKSQGDTFLFDKTLAGTTIRRQYPAGQLFYNWLDKVFYGGAPAKYEMGNESELLAGFAGELGISLGRFMQRDPLAPVTGGTMLQGELIDAFGRRVYEATQRTGFKECSSRCKREIQSAISKTERYFGRLENNHPQLNIQRFELHYREDPNRGEISVIENAQHLDQLNATLQEQDKLGMLVGYWWKRRYLPECGYGIHLIQLIDVQRGNPKDHGARVQAIWQHVTKGHGTVVELPYLPGNHRCWGANAISTPHSSPSPLNEVMKSVRMMLDSERYLRLVTKTNHSHWGMGDLPPAAPHSSTWQDAGQVKSPFDLAAATAAAPFTHQRAEVAQA